MRFMALSAFARHILDLQMYHFLLELIGVPDEVVKSTYDLLKPA